MSSASDASFLLEVPDHDSVFSVLSFNASEEISSTFEVNLTVSCTDEIAFESLQLQEALFTIIGKQTDRYFHGLIRKFRQSGKINRNYIYQVQIVPTLHFLYLKENCRIFQKKSVKEITGTILEEHDIAGDKVEWRLANDLPPRRFCVQYQESDLEFISRLLEEEGIFFFFEHYADKHVLVFCDTEAFYRDIEGDATLSFNSNDGLVAEKESVKSFAVSERTRSGKFIHKNYNFKHPSLDLSTEDKGDGLDELFSYEYHGLYGNTERGKHLATVRLQEIHTLKKKGRGISNIPRLTPGATFTLSDHPCSQFNDSHLIVEVMHEGKQPQAIGEFASGEAARYSNVLMVIPSEVIYRPERITPKPIVPGIQTATVTGPPGEDINVDKYGRVKVQFHWDKDGNKDDNTSCWLRVNQFWNGATRGSQFIPRVGDEVLVAFVNGDMDFPIILGSAINEAKQPTYNLPANKTQSGIRTRSTPGGGPNNFNELRFEDKKGAEEVYLQSEKDWNILVKNDKGQMVGGNSNTTVEKSLSKTAEDITLTANSRITIVCGGSTITLDPSGITIKGGTIRMNE
jgi:type VI secretion system secreted protein VgrG